jgi:phytanoyl-CoA hydroxylase
MLTDEQVAQFNRDGYLRSGRILSDAQVGVLQEEMARVLRDKDNPAAPQPVMLHNMGGENPIWQIVNIWEASDPFRELVHNQTIAEEMAQLTGAKTLRIWHDQVQYKPASTGGVNMWHQDAPYWPVLMPMTEVSAWVALDDVDEENGCMSMVPGSHQWGNQINFIHTLKAFGDMPEEFQGRKIEVKTCPVKKGEVHFHHALTWHGSAANTSTRPRRAIAIHFMTDETCFITSGDHVMKPFMHMADGEVVQGEHFPVVWER